MGCHHNRKAGGYHCHRGPLAGQSFASKEDAARALQRASQPQPSARSSTPPPPAATPAPAVLSGVASVIDGDTLEIHGQRIRLHGIDAPESAQLCKDTRGKDYRCGQQAALALADRIGRRPIECEKRDVDHYKRIVAVCRLGSEVLNAWLVSEGWAMAYRHYSREYVPQETQARKVGRGIWRGEFAPPWDWRNRAGR
ncbi:MAG: thermonuclease family protein [Rhodospirillales bacterium]|nr:thermonuclease family protein [Rhodospirillales bacterium]